MVLVAMVMFGVCPRMVANGRAETTHRLTGTSVIEMMDGTRTSRTRQMPKREHIKEGLGRPGKIIDLEAQQDRS